MLTRLRRQGSWWAGACLVVAALAAVTARSPGQRPQPSGEFSAEAASRHIRAVAAEPRPSGSPANAAAREHLVRELRELGLEPEVQRATIAKDWGSVAPAARGTVLSGTVANVLTRVPGTASTGALLLMAHYDTVAVTPGAGDDAAGVAALLEVARVLRTRPVRNDVIILLSDGHELGLLGAEAFRRHHPWASDVALALNLEGRGGGGRAVLFAVHGNGPWLVGEYASTAPRPLGSSLLTGLAAVAPAPTDLAALLDRPVAGLDFSLAEEWPRYHTPRDTADALDAASIRHQGETAVRLALHFADLDLAQARAPRDAVFVAVPGAGVLRHPGALVAPLLLLVTVLGAGLLLEARRRRVLRLRATVLEGVRLVVAVLATGASGALAVGGYHLASGHALALPLGGTYAWRAAGLAVLSVALAGGLAVLRLGATREAAERLGGTFAVWWLLTALTAGTVPGASYLFSWPLLAAQLGLLVTAAGGARPAVPAALVALLAGAVVGLPTVELIGLALGPPGFVLAACLTLLLVAPARAFGGGAVSLRGRWAPVTSGARRHLPLVLLTAGVLGLAAHVLATRPSAAHPRTAHLAYWLDDDRSSGSWLSLSGSPDGRATGGTGAAERHDLADYLPALSDREVHVTPAAAVDLAPPRLEVLGDSTVERLRVVRLRLSSPRGAPTLRLFVTSPTPVSAAQVSGTRLSYPRPPASWWLKAATVPTTGLEVSLAVPPGQALELLLVDTSPGLPAALPPRPPSRVPWAEPLMLEDSSLSVARRVVLEPPSTT